MVLLLEPEGPTKALMAAAQGQDEVGEGVDQLAPIVPDVSYQVSHQPHHQIFDGQALFACCLYGNPPLWVGRFDFCASFAILRLEFANQT